MEFSEPIRYGRGIQIDVFNGVDMGKKIIEGMGYKKEVWVSKSSYKSLIL